MGCSLPHMPLKCATHETSKEVRTQLLPLGKLQLGHKLRTFAKRLILVCHRLSGICSSSTRRAGTMGPWIPCTLCLIASHTVATSQQSLLLTVAPLAVTSLTLMLEETCYSILSTGFPCDPSLSCETTHRPFGKHNAQLCAWPRFEETQRLAHTCLSARLTTHDKPH